MRSMISPFLPRFFSDFDWINPPDVEISQKELEQWIALIESYSSRDEVVFEIATADKDVPERYSPILHQDILGSIGFFEFL